MRKSYQIVSNQKLSDGVFELIVECPDLVKASLPGQFVNLYCRHEGRLLPRPISICEADRQTGSLHLVYAVLGIGTGEISNYKSGEMIDMMGPFGNGFDCGHKGDDHLIVAGGVGTPPMVELCRHLEGRKTIVLGFRTRPFLVDRFESFGNVFVATDDGSEGLRGNVIDVLNTHNLVGRIYGCGPTPMLKNLQKYTQENNLTAALSLEERMGCGFGGCVGCVTRVAADNDAGYAYKKVCKDGPVFDAREVIFP